ncbi:uncharacterized protein LOC134203259 [Armigeres subalbatus]|uniref:uncharacterized protein LOC134203259 n=1 Tax=Armigeres subalbatus TaxID=124917 RepID=UPI002ED190B0
MAKQNVKRAGTKYFQENVQKAVLMVNEGVPLRVAAKRFEIPKSTLEDRVKGRYKHQLLGAPKALLEEDEIRIVNFIIDKAKAGHPVDEKRAIVHVAEVAKSIGKEAVFKNGIPSRGWFARFMKRHPELSRRTANNLSKTRVVTELDVRKWFNGIKEYLEKQDNFHILNEPQRVFNMDEMNVKTIPYLWQHLQMEILRRR